VLPEIKLGDKVCNFSLSISYLSKIDDNEWAYSPKVAARNLTAQLKIFFAQALRNIANFIVTDLSQLSMKGDLISTKIFENEYINGVEGCKKILHVGY